MIQIEEVFQMVRANGLVPGLSKLLVEEAMKRRKYSLDNISLIVVNLQKLQRVAA